MTKFLKNSLITVFISLALFILAMLFSSVAFAVSTATVNDSDGVNMRSGPGTSYNIITALPNRTVCTVIESAKDSKGNVWYKCTYNGYTGYMIGEYLIVKMDEEKSYVPEEDFEKHLENQGFPDSYKYYLRKLHAKYPKWVFIAQKTGVSWSDLLSKESSNHRNLVHKSYPDSWKSTASADYDAKTGEYTVYDSGGWVAASKEIIAYYLDPRNFMDGDSTFMFMAQSYNALTQTKEGLKNIVAGTFLDAKFPENGYDTYSDVLIYAAQQSGVNPYLLASMIIIEQGAKGQGGCINDGEYWNYYNWGAYASGGKSAVANGIEYAASGTSYMRPWNTRLKSLVGGAIYYADGYINNKQDTLYLKKFNVMNGLSKVGTHQYMTNVRAAYDEAMECCDGYDYNSAITFYIPVYSGMPDAASPMPGTGNNNFYLDKLSVSGYNLAPKFDKYTNDYEIIVPSDTAKIVISATASDSNAKITGIGDIELAGNNAKANIKVTSTSGAVNTYVINISKEAPPIEEVAGITTEYNLGTYITGVKRETSFSAFNSSIKTTGGATFKVLDSKGKEITSGNIGTGMQLAVYNKKGESIQSYTISILGDCSGDGKCNSLDLLMVQKFIVGTQSLSNAYFQAGDVNNDGKVNSLDLLYIQKSIVGSYTLPN